MLTSIINYMTFIAFIALTLDVIFQIFRVAKKKSSGDISLRGCILRVIAVLIFEIKFILLDDPWLVLGQGIFGSIFLTYFFLVLLYRK